MRSGNVRTAAAIFAAVSVIAAGTTTAIASTPRGNSAPIVEEDESYTWVADLEGATPDGDFPNQATCGSCGVCYEDLEKLRNFADRKGGA